MPKADVRAAKNDLPLHESGRANAPDIDERFLAAFARFVYRTRVSRPTPTIDALAEKMKMGLPVGNGEAFNFLLRLYWLRGGSH